MRRSGGTGDDAAGSGPLEAACTVEAHCGLCQLRLPILMPQNPLCWLFMRSVVMDIGRAYNVRIQVCVRVDAHTQTHRDTHTNKHTHTHTHTHTNTHNLQTHTLLPHIRAYTRLSATRCHE